VNSSATIAAPTSSSLKERARADAVLLFLSHWRASLIGVSVLTAIVALALHDYVPAPLRAIWCTLAFINYISQSVVSWKLESAHKLADAIPRWLPWLHVSVVVSGLVWGLMPWMLIGSARPVLLFACLFNVMLLFCVTNSPCTPSLVVSAVMPMLLTPLALLAHGGLQFEGAACLTLCGLVFVYGWRVQSAILSAMVERHVAKDLTTTLQMQQARLMEVERERTLLLERQRLMRDMHDGLGSVLTSSLAVVERGEARPAELALMLRECVDDLRAVIDSLEPAQNDLVALLATQRYRLGPRLEAAGIQLEWDMHDLPPLPWMEPPEALQVMRMMQEVLTNIVKHSGAQRVLVSAQQLGDSVVVRVVDDGCGFDVQAAPTGRGLRFLHQRAASLGGALSIISTSGKGTTVQLSLPINH
jgi:signal transduction histidine kinase